MRTQKSTRHSLLHYFKTHIDRIRSSILANRSIFLRVCCTGGALRFEYSTLGKCSACWWDFAEILIASRRPVLAGQYRKSQCHPIISVKKKMPRSQNSIPSLRIPIFSEKMVKDKGKNPKSHQPPMPPLRRPSTRSSQAALNVIDHRTGTGSGRNSASSFPLLNGSPSCSSHSLARTCSRSPVRTRSRSPVRMRSRSPLRARSHSPVRTRSRSPVRTRSRSPCDFPSIPSGSSADLATLSMKKLELPPMASIPEDERFEVLYDAMVKFAAVIQDQQKDISCLTRLAVSILFALLLVS